jgi:hypothetical protein
LSAEPDGVLVGGYRQAFLDAAVRMTPVVGRFLRRYGLRARPPEREAALNAWQKHFDLLPGWARDAAERTLSVWICDPGAAADLKFSVPVRARNIGGKGLATFRATRSKTGEWFRSRTDPAWGSRWTSPNSAGAFHFTTAGR